LHLFSELSYSFFDDIAHLKAQYSESKTKVSQLLEANYDSDSKAPDFKS